MSRISFLRTIVSSLFLQIFKVLMTQKNIIQKNLLPEIHKDFKKSHLDILTEENDQLLKSLKRPSGSHRVA